MAITKWDPWDLMPRGSWLSDDWPRRMDSSGLDVYETENEVVVEAAIPGLSENDVEVTYEDGILHISGEKRTDEETKKKKKVVHRETSYTSFDYTTTLPRAVEAEKIDAEVEDGIVKVTAPIAAASRPRKIEAKRKSK